MRSETSTSSSLWPRISARRSIIISYARIAFSCALIVIPPNSTLGGEHSDATDDVQQSENHVLVEIIG